MSLSAFTIIKNAIKYDFPIVESINSLLPIVDEYVVDVGKSDDGTEELLLRNFSKYFTEDNKVRYLPLHEWTGTGTSFISEETNAALNICRSDWVFYLQADEVIHEEDLPFIKEAIKKAEEKGKYGITLKYLHFAGDPNHIYKDYKDGSDHYDKELRIFRNTGELISFGDGQSFSSLLNGYFDSRGPQPVLHQKERFLDSDIRVFHYSYLRDKKRLLEKKKFLQECYNISEPNRREEIKEDKDGYFIDPAELKEFKGTHPAVMRDFLERFK